MKINNKKTIAVIIILFISIIAIKKCTKHFDQGLIKSLSENLPNTKSLNEEYLTIIKEKYRNKALVNIIRNSKIRNPIAAIPAIRIPFRDTNLNVKINVVSGSILVDFPVITLPSVYRYWLSSIIQWRKELEPFCNWGFC
jgi:hypothetical protein